MFILSIRCFKVYNDFTLSDKNYEDQENINCFCLNCENEIISQIKFLHLFQINISNIQIFQCYCYLFIVQYFVINIRKEKITKYCERRKKLASKHEGNLLTCDFNDYTFHQRILSSYFYIMMVINL